MEVQNSVISTFNELVDELSSSTQLFLCEELLSSDIGLKMIRMSLDLLNNFFEKHFSHLKGIKAEELFKTFSLLLQALQDEDFVKNIYKLITQIFDEEEACVSDAVKTPLAEHIIFELKKDPSNAPIWKTGALDKMVFRASKADTSKLLDMGILDVCVGLLKNDELEAKGHGVYAINNLLSEHESRKDGTEHPLGNSLRNCGADALLVNLMNEEDVLLGYKHAAALCVGAMLQGKAANEQTQGAVVILKKLVENGEDFQVRMALMRLRLMAVVEENHALILMDDFLSVLKRVYMNTTDTFTLRHSIQLLINLISEGTLSTISKVKENVVPRRLIELTSHSDQFVRSRAISLCSLCEIPLSTSK
ncbi:uncharacterized protein MONOS_15342 [Monocercomonoides exilis]|uniref:uncharacterized protein n=1 Tax=Monocercomonoides exilis TaxID=2049356 RepID=UPI003559EB17|nr:hypothetical protein MONOS_15342 [Monocercomonoides exilis]|eukprot:MONOS_15342.1-p1 / transcript=MONOS_15342.1 / gene=MONOS_15342 / organism=Monocercomonoides_exilis_PA203 / gene_product=unspecified product / transcript_product=unspecified product / location=Mono_scaffold01203:3535-5087(+) / protein_length=363 / sequence_SO=supercontig / SO=protein_coding / is_pseudo=false